MMALAHYVANYGDELVCDLAETYGLFNWRALPCTTVATLADGLGFNSRINAKISGTLARFDEIMQARIVDALEILIWQNTKDGQKNRNRPKSLVDAIVKGPTSTTERGASFRTEDDLKAALAVFEV